ncbi:MAG: tetratricopeptide repeat protein [Isosphaeraceae bacterium]|nr:tetratricopeptide repeat protein [Isosphaeraceae bacterium]
MDADSLLREFLSRSPEARTEFLDRRCEGRPEVRELVESMLALIDSHPIAGAATAMTVDDEPTNGTSGSSRTGSPTQHVRTQPGDSPTATISQSTLDETSPGTRSTGDLSRPAASATQTIAGRYMLRERIGEGGMGEVWIADQTEPVRRKVAVKLIRAGMDSTAVLRRFEQERQALAMMDHPNIAKVLDGGLTPLGRPYFVMEFVPGLPLTEYCDRHRLSLQDRLDLFIPICQAVQHAHQKGIVHRDLKPANILVSTVDDKPVPKVIDFGVAKATSGNLTDESMATQVGAIIGTLEYMSPEQAGRSGDDIDTRADIYSLGVILYELLTGLRPIDAKRLRNASLPEIIRIIREEDPQKPSTRIAAEESLQPTRRTAPGRQLSRLRSELDWIVMKCLEKQRDRRYDSVNGLVRDLQRFLADEPVEARPPSTGYRMAKFLRRNRAAATAAALVVAALLAGLMGTLAGLVRAEERRVEAETARREESRQRTIASRELERSQFAESEAEKRAEEVRTISEFQSAMLARVDPAKAGLDLTVDVKRRLDESLAEAGIPPEDRAKRIESFASDWSRINATDAALRLIDNAILRPGAEEIAKRFSDQPLVRATLSNSLGERYRDLGLFEPAQPLLEAAVESRRRLLGPDAEETIESMAALANLLESRGKSDEALAMQREALERSRRALGPEHPSTIGIVANVGYLESERGEFDAAESHLREAVALFEKVKGENDATTFSVLSTLANVLDRRGESDEAAEILERNQENARRIYGETSIDFYKSASHLGALLYNKGKYQEAETQMRIALEGYRRFLGEAHPDTLLGVQKLAAAVEKLGKTGEAESLMRGTLAKQRLLLGSDHGSTLMGMSNFAVFLLEHGKQSEAESLARETLERRVRVFGRENPATLVSFNIMSYVLMRQGKPADAEPIMKEQIAISRKINGDSHRDTLTYTYNLGRLFIEQKKAAEAEPLIAEVVEKATKSLGLEHPITLSATSQLASLMNARNQYEPALALLAKIEPTLRASDLPESATNLGLLLTRKARALIGLQRFADAEPALLEAREIPRKSQGENAVATGNATLALITLYELWHAAEPTKGFDAKAAEWKARYEAGRPKIAAPKPAGP